MAAKTTTRKAPRLSNEERSAKIKDLAIALTEWRESLDDDQVDAYDDRFAGYSTRNALLIVMQDPNATVVHGFHAWKDFGRKVAKGAKGIAILAPAGSKTTTKTDTATPAPADGPAGEVDTIRRFFRIVYVFDIAATEPLSATESDAALTEALAA